MKRRQYIALAGSLMAGVTGCVGGSSQSDKVYSPSNLPEDTHPLDGYPPSFTDTPNKRPVETKTFPTVTVERRPIPLAPIDIVYYWYRRRESRIVDARGSKQYRKSHIFGAVSSPAPRGGEANALEDWPNRDRIVCYCGCPHHLSALRAANLLAEGYTNVYVLDEGFWEWHDRDYPIVGRNIDAKPAVYKIDGRTKAVFAGQFAWAWHEDTNQQEAAIISKNGAYSLKLRFSDITIRSLITVDTPGYQITAPLYRLISGSITHSDVK